MIGWSPGSHLVNLPNAPMQLPHLLAKNEQITIFRRTF
jgi:hypothetical protein